LTNKSKYYIMIYQRKENSNMKNFFDRYPEFIESDTRTTRINPKDGYPISAEFLEKRYLCTMPTGRCQGKKILDLGSCTGSLGAWCLANGAASYTGVEIQKKFVADSRNNLAKHFANNWQIVESTVEQFLQNNTEHYDIVVASGVIYGVADMHGCLRQLAKIADYIVIEAKHPPSLIQLALRCLEMKEIIELKQAIIEVLSVPMIYEDANHKVLSLGFNPSIGALTTIFQSLDFVPDLTVYNDLKSTLGEIYGLTESNYFRYGIGFQKTAIENKLVSFAEVYQNSDLLNKSLRKFE
jgi:precorrin-6B methylase 2